MDTPGYTLVVGADERHLKQLAWTWPTWKRHKPSLLNHPMIVFVDDDSLMGKVYQLVDHPRLVVVKWPPLPTNFHGDSTTKWNNAQRYKMLAGFVHVPAMVETPYWLKIDTDVVATGNDDWVDAEWFHGQPAIISAPWTFTKPADQMMRLDKWAGSNNVPGKHLNLIPLEGSTRLGHRRIISFVGFFKSTFTQCCSNWAGVTCGSFQLPVPSQDGYMWYMAERMGMRVVRPRMKMLGWQQLNKDAEVERYARLAMEK